MKGSHTRIAETLNLGDDLVLPFLGGGNIWVEDNPLTGASFGLTQQIIHTALRESAPGLVSVIAYDEALTGVVAPFSQLNSGSERMLTTITHANELPATLSFLRDHIHSVNELIQGRATDLTAFQRTMEQPAESYILVVIAADVPLLDDQVQTDLASLLRAGPRCGVSFLIHSMTQGANPYLMAICDRLVTTAESEVHLADLPQLKYRFRPPDAMEMIGSVRELTDVLANSQQRPVTFASIQSVEQPWSHSSVDGITFSLGSFGGDLVEVTLGDEVNQRHNMIVTGAVGQGKSNLLSVMIHSLCTRYGPNELSLYLLDFKEGVTLQRYFNPQTGVFLPHASVLGLDADPDFGMSTLRHLFTIYKQRMSQFKRVGVQNIREFRLAHPGKSMPRIVLMIDEFQMLFSDSRSASEQVTELLINAVRLFRASGIHIVLASQVIGGNVSLMGAVGEALFAQVPVRIALKNSINESFATLGAGNAAAAHLKARQAIVNLDYGEVTANCKVAIAHADETALEPLRRKWWSDAGPDAAAPFVFEGERRRCLADDARHLARLQETGHDSRPGHVALLGASMTIAPRPLELHFPRRTGTNLVAIGGNAALPTVLSLACSLALAAPGQCQFVVLNCVSEPGAVALVNHFLSLLSETGQRPTVIYEADVPDAVRRLATAVAERPMETETFVLGLGLEACRDMPPEFSELAQVGPRRGLHLLGWWTKVDSFRTQADYSGEPHFDLRLAIGADPRSTAQLLQDPLAEVSQQDNRGIVVDASSSPTPRRFIPYSYLPESVPTF